MTSTFIIVDGFGNMLGGVSASYAADIAAAKASLTAADAARATAYAAQEAAMYLLLNAPRLHTEAVLALEAATAAVEVAMRNVSDCYRAVKAQEVKP